MKMEMEIELKGKKRRELQALCKRHGIPANLTNLEMAQRLSLHLQQKTEEEEEKEANCKKAKKVVKFSPETQTFTYEAQSEECIVRRRRNGVKRKEPTPSVVGLRRSARLNNTPNIDEGPSTCTEMESDEKENMNASQYSFDVDGSDEIGEKEVANVDTCSVSNKIQSDNSELSGVLDDVVIVDDGSYKLMKKDDQRVVDEVIVAKGYSDYDDQTEIVAICSSKENDLELSSQAKLSLDIFSNSHESYEGFISQANSSSPLGNMSGFLNARDDVTGKVAGNDDTDSCKGSSDELDAINGPFKEHNLLTRESLEECDDKCQDAQSVRSEYVVQEVGELIVPLPDIGPHVHSVEVNNWEMNTSLLDGGEGDVKIQYKLDVEADIGLNIEENVNMDEDAEDNEIRNKDKHLKCEEWGTETKSEIFVKNLKMDEDVDQGLERKVVNEQAVYINGEDGVGLERQVNEHEPDVSLIPDIREHSIIRPEAYIGICSPFGDMYRSPNVREEIRSANRKESSEKGSSIAISGKSNSSKYSSDVSHSHGPDAKSVRSSEADLQEFVCSLKGEIINAEDSISLTDDSVSQLLVPSEEITSFNINMNSKDGEESDVKIQHILDLAASERRDADKIVVMNEDVELGFERQVDGVAGSFVSENGEADIVTQNKGFVGDVLLNEDVEFASVKEVNEHAHHIGPIVESSMTSEDFEISLEREVSEAVASLNAIQSELIVEAASRGSDTKVTEQEDSALIEEFMKCETGIYQFMGMGPLPSVVKPEMCEGSEAIDVGSGSVFLDQTSLGDGMTKHEGDVASFVYTENNDGLSCDSAKCTDMCEDGVGWKDMVGTFTLDGHLTSGKRACESERLADKVVSPQDSVTFEKYGDYSESNGENVDALGSMLECVADHESRVVLTVNDNIGPTMDEMLDVTLDENQEGVYHESNNDFSNIESLQIADAQMELEFVQKRASMDSVNVSADILSKKQGGHLHKDKVHDMKENQQSTKSEHLGSISAVRNSAHRRPLQDLQKN